jgi:hypothetical protein
MKLIDIAFDLDGTLIKLMPVFERIIWEKYKAKVPETRSFKIFTEPDLPYKTIIECFSEAFKCIDEIELHAGVRELFYMLWNLAEQNDPIKIVTARPMSSVHDTYNLVNRICRDVDYEVVIVERSEEKWKHLLRYNHFVDDRRKTALDLASHGKTVWMPVRNYNQPLPRNNFPIIEIESLKDLMPLAKNFIKVIKEEV